MSGWHQHGTQPGPCAQYAATSTTQQPHTHEHDVPRLLMMKDALKLAQTRLPTDERVLLLANEATQPSLVATAWGGKKMQAISYKIHCVTNTCTYCGIFQ